ncbi:MAG: peptidase [Planctomycetota bacterium]|nr:MAG: peptidase [Planctomycetota bacterium]
MDFFSEQDQARRRSGRLVLLFLIAVILMMAIIYVVAIIAWNFADEGQTTFVWWQPVIFALSVGGTAAVIIMGSLGRIASLSAGGPAVAEMVGAQRVDPGTTDPDERRLLNIVEEMALASGTPVPPVYVMEEKGINAFAAGYRYSDAVVGVTRGAMQRLTRDELQGVIAHEFSHILHGDMRLNIRLMGILYGILMISAIGSIMMRAIYLAGGRRRSSSRNNSDGAIYAIAAAGLVMYIIGYLGVFFGSMIKAAVSRQREFLADASAVQYTRNPDGIGGALKKLAGHHSRVEQADAQEASHFFFGPISGFGSALATHPPLQERIRRIDPQFQGERQATSTGTGGNSAAMAGMSSMAGNQPASAQSMLNSIGDPDARHMDMGIALLAGLPQHVHDASHDPYSARAVIHCLLLDEDPALVKKQWEHLQAHADRAVFAEVQRHAPAIMALPHVYRLPLVELSLPALRTMTRAQVEQFLSVVDLLIAADEQVSAYEYSLRHHLRLALDPEFARSVSGTAQAEDVRVLLHIVAALGNPTDATLAQAAFVTAAKEVGLSSSLQQYDSAMGHDWQAMDAALVRLAQVKPKSKRRIIAAAITAVSHNERVNRDEGDIIRAIALSLECPMPPLVVDEDVAA